MPKRPRSVTIIAWILIAIALIGAHIIWRSLTNPNSARELAALNLIGYLRYLANSLAPLVCGIGLLCRQNWARWILVAWFGERVVANALPWNVTLLPQVLLVISLFSLPTFFLFRSEATAYFQGRPGRPREISTPDEDISR
jgi:hypothetical protein